MYACVDEAAENHFHGMLSCHEIFLGFLSSALCSVSVKGGLSIYGGIGARPQVNLTIG